MTVIPRFFERFLRSVSPVWQDLQPIATGRRQLLLGDRWARDLIFAYETMHRAAVADFLR